MRNEWRPTMPNLQVRDIDAQLYHWLCANAKLANHSISQHVITILQEKAAAPQKTPTTAVDAFLALNDSWGDDRSAEEIVSEIRNSRINTSARGNNFLRSVIHSGK